ESRYTHDGVPVYRYPIPAEPTRDEVQHLAVTRGAERFHAWLQHARPDVVHMHTFVTGLSLAELRAARDTGARVVSTTHSASLGFTCQRGTMMRWGRTLCDGQPDACRCSACYLHHAGVAKPMASLLSLVPPAISEATARLPGRLGTALGMPALIE